MCLLQVLQVPWCATPFRGNIWGRTSETVYDIICDRVARDISSFDCECGRQSSLFVYAIVGLKSFAFIQPLVSLLQIDNFEWVTHEDDNPFSSPSHIFDFSSGRSGCTSSKKRNQKLRRKEKVMLLVMFYILGGGVIFGNDFLSGSDFPLWIFSCLFIVAIVLKRNIWYYS